MKEVLSQLLALAHYPSELCGSISLLTDGRASLPLSSTRPHSLCLIEERFARVDALFSEVPSFDFIEKKSYLIKRAVVGILSPAALLLSIPCLSLKPT